MASYKTPGVYVEEVPSGSAPIAGVGTSTAGFIGALPDNTVMAPGKTLASVGEVKLITNFTEFKDSFGDYASGPAAPGYVGHSYLAHAVRGFFDNGGTRCFVTRVSATGDPAPGLTTIDIDDALALLEPIDEIAIVAAPGMTGAAQYSALTTHCELMLSRFAILDSPLEVTNLTTELGPAGTKLPPSSSYSALYFPWIQVADPMGAKFVPPSGHVAGIYARVDTTRGVHKAPANETIRGALELKYAISKAQQEGLNLHGVNCLRRLNGNIKVWGARTAGGAANTEFTYVSVRRLFIFLRESIDQSLQWAVFEPNAPDLWAKITRNLTAFLENVRTSGGLFGDTAEQAFYVKCDAETNPPAIRDLGQVVTEIGVAITRPAEFVIFRLGQKTAS